MTEVQSRDETPHLGSSRCLGQNVDVPAAQVSTRMAGDRVGTQQRGVRQKYNRAEPQSEAVGKGKGPNPVDEEDDRERERRIEEVAVNVLEDQREARLTRIAAGGGR